MANKISNLFMLPFVHNYRTPLKSFVTMEKVQVFLGNNFYSRLNRIYSNIIEAFAKKNYKYLSQVIQPNLWNQLSSEITSIESGRYKLRIHMPKGKITAKKQSKIKKYIPVQETIWSNQTTKIGLQCNVFFGEDFNKKDPLKKNIGNPQSKVFRFGQFRYIRYYPNLSLIENLKNMYENQTYELIVKYCSKMYLQILNFDEVHPSNKSEENEELMSEIVFRSSNKQFDWVIIDINGYNYRFRQSKEKIDNRKQNTEKVEQIQKSSAINSFEGSDNCQKNQQNIKKDRTNDNSQGIHPKL